MKLWSEIIPLRQPLRDARLNGAAKAALLSEASTGTAAVAAPAASMDELVKASYERGRLDGEKALSEQLLQQRTEMQELFHGALTALRAAVPQVLRDTEQALVTLALEMARKLVGELPITAAMVEAAVREALAQVEDTTETQVRLNPADLQLLQKTTSPLLDDTDETRKVRLVSSPDVPPGGCLVHTRFGVIDARRETKFELLKEGLLS